MVNKQMQAQRMKKYFVEAAYNILVEQGMDNLTVRNIAKKAGYSYATIYNYFNNFDELLWAVGVKVLNNLSDMLEEHYKNEKEKLKGVKLLNSVYKKYIDFFLENENLYHFIFFKNIKTIDLRDIKKDPPPNLFNLQQTIMQTFVSEGLIKEKNKKITGELLTNSINGLLSLYFSGKEGLSKRELHLKAKQYVEYLISD
jgi:hypothetical protein